MTDDKANSGLESIAGIGPATMKKLKAMKITTVQGLSKASQKTLEAGGIATSSAKKIIAAAKAAMKVQSATKKAKTSAKKATKKTSSAAKKAVESVSKASSKAASASKDVADKVVKATKQSAHSLTHKSSKDRKGKNISIPRSVKDMPWFNKK